MTQDLIDRVEALSEPDREVDVLIAHLIRWRWDGWEDGDLRIEEREVAYIVERVERGHNSIWNSIPRYTASLDAAMTLVLEGWAIEALSCWPASPDGADNASAPQASARLVGTSISRFGKRMIWAHRGGDGRAEGNSTDPALALTAAALRARLTSEGFPLHPQP